MINTALVPMFIAHIRMVAGEAERCGNSEASSPELLTAADLLEAAHQALLALPDTPRNSELLREYEATCERIADLGITGQRNQRVTPDPTL